MCQCELTYLDETLLWAILTATVRCKADPSLAVFAHLHAARSTRGREPQWIMPLFDLINYLMNMVYDVYEVD